MSNGVFIFLSYRARTYHGRRKCIFLAHLASANIDSLVRFAAEEGMRPSAEIRDVSGEKRACYY